MITNPFYRSILKSMLGRYAVYAANFLSLMVLARLFTPELFGTVASITVFFLFFQVMSEAGLGPAIINLDKLEPEDRNGLFGLTLVAGLALAVLFLALSPVLQRFYGLPRVDEVVPYTAAALLFFAAAIVPNALLLREQAFFRIANAGLAAEVASTTLTIALAQVIDPLHALAAKATTTAVTNFVLLYGFSRATEFGRPQWGTRFSAIRPILGFSAYQFGFNVINYFARNLDNILVGKYLGAGALGIYDKAYQLMRYPLLLLTFAMTPAIQPVIRRYAGDREKVEALHRDFTFKLSLLGGAAGLGVYVLADLIVRITLGDNWSAVVPIIQVLAIAIPVQVVLATSGSFFQAMNRADLLFLSGVLGSLVMVLAIAWGIYMRDMLLLSWGLVVAFHVNFAMVYFILYRKVFLANIARFLVRILPAAALVAGMAVHLESPLFR